jgi:hypothetical protein
VRRGLGLGLLLLATTMLPACSTQVAFKQDKRVHILFPHARQKVKPPLTVHWTVEDFDVTGPTPAKAEHAGYFALLVDRSPQPPGQPLSWFARNDDVCRRVPACPDTAYLNRHDIYTTTDTSFAVPVLRAPPSGSKGKDMHEVTVVLLDGTGRRIGETAFAVEFEVPRVRL